MARARRRPAGGRRGYDRTDRLNSLLFRILAEELEVIDDERFGFLTVTGVSTDRDLTIASVFVTSDAEGEELFEALEEHRPRLQKAVAQQARLRRVPPLRFVSDEAVQSADRIEAILRDLEAGDA
ncbi:MAG: 30S ribosome-binding factor RbfA [Actinobacteria bacterium]|jgi:ribosome-binding factor A|nr:30S ribosome-binding factor RbfA [Actinomycetota bacterium]MDP7549968.1 30S ribosome-binding factor RbfA [Acidimicrobiales bacterium]MBT3687400.1 30S ribosome-binding factor RbfA [Actinomycetota bacterium]MBT4036797.1 30S ribosome-binding factor RbfA [Actinomycetota bacterium]MBT4279653.1 30S ribosome-binding factor RbfA [Actinomycetota bacterium]|tara:strand:+ start:2471 stop:2845 length:375 start_codon:yes stop_codon:yes gene_type:complete